MQQEREQQALQLAALQQENEGLKNQIWHLKAEIEQYNQGNRSLHAAVRRIGRAVVEQSEEEEGAEEMEGEGRAEVEGER